MQQFDFYINPDGPGYLLILQSDLVPGFNTTVVVPLIAVGQLTQPTHRLHPIFHIADADYVMATHLMSAVPVSVLKDKAGDFRHAHVEIVNALDMLFSSV